MEPDRVIGNRQALALAHHEMGPRDTGFESRQIEERCQKEVRTHERVALRGMDSPTLVAAVRNHLAQPPKRQQSFVELEGEKFLMSCSLEVVPEHLLVPLAGLARDRFPRMCCFGAQMALQGVGNSAVGQEDFVQG